MKRLSIRPQILTETTLMGVTMDVKQNFLAFLKHEISQIVGSTPVDTFIVEEPLALGCAAQFGALVRHKDELSVLV